MNAYTYDFEVQTMSTALMNAFSDIVIKRFNVNKDTRDQIKTRVVYAPKQRVLLDLLDKDQNLQLPVISVNIGGVARDESRVFNKIMGTFYTPANSTASVHEKGVLPVDVTYNISIMTRFQQDMDQILSHLIAYVNPYFIISWRTPSRPDHEIRSKVMWEGGVSLEYPIDQAATQVARVVANLTFVFKGWIFQKSETIENIYIFDTNFVTAGKQEFETLLLTDHNSLTGLDSISVDQFVYSAAPPQPKIVEPFFARVNARQVFNIWGAGFGSITNIYLSGAPVDSISSPQDPFGSIPALSATNPSFFGVRLLSSDWTFDKYSGGATFITPLLNISGRLEVIAENIKGYGKLTTYVPVNTFNPYPVGNPLHDTFVPEQLPYAEGIVIFGINHPYQYGPYWAVEQKLHVGSTLFLTQTASYVAPNINEEAVNGHLVSTDQRGIVTSYRIYPHPYLITLNAVNYYYDERPIANNITMFQGTSTFQTSNSAEGTADINLDGNLDTWNVSTSGILTWVMVSAHPFRQLGYYTNTLNLSSGISVLYSAVGTAATPVTGISGTADVNGDNNLDNWSTNLSGIVSWTMISAHPYSNLSYYTNNETLSSGISILYTSPGTGATVVSNVTGIPVDVDGDTSLDMWVTDLSGVVYWTTALAHLYSNLGYYTNTVKLTSGVSVLYENPGSGSTVAVNVTGTSVDLNDDGNEDNWNTNADGIITWTTKIAHPYIQLGSYTERGYWIYSNDQPLINGSSRLYVGQGTGAALLTGASSSLDLDGDGNLDTWTTNTSGIITWHMISAHPYYYPIFGGYSDYISITAMQGAIIYNGQGSAAAVVGISSAIYDVDGDGNLDTWTTNTSGIVTWVMLSAHPYSNLSYYTDAEVLSSGISILYNSKGTGATVAVNVTGVLIDIDGDTSKDVWITNSSGVISWEPAKFYFWNTDPEQCVWWNATSWWNNLSHTISAEMLPLSTSNVIILGTIPVSADLDRVDWVQPRSLNTGTAEVIFYSELYNTVTIDITGNTTFALSSVYAPL